VLQSVLDCLCYASKTLTLVGGEGDAETRRNAIISLVNVCKTVGIDSKNTMPIAEADAFPIHRLTKKQTKMVFHSLLSAMDDYNTDRRGDVGSWSRIAAMDGFQAFANLSIKASTGFPHSPGQVTSSDPSALAGPNEEVIVPSFEKRLDFLRADVLSKKVDQSLDDTIFFDEQMCCSMLSALLKQLGEKLDTVRCKAGECLETLLTNDSPRLPFVPYRHMLVRALNVSNERDKNWSDPALTFPLLMRAINIDEFTVPILSGVVISVGGLTESVSKNSSASLFEWIRGLRTAKATPKIFRMGEVFLGLFHRHKKNGRVLLPLLSTLDKLLSHGCLDELLCAKNGMFIIDLMSCLTSEAKGCCDVKRLLAIVGVSLNLLQPHHETVSIMRDQILPFIMTMLLNPYPRVRRFTAEQLYVKLVEDGDILVPDKHECLEEANQLLLRVVWHDELDPHGQLSDSRNRIADLLGISLTMEQRNVKIGERRGKSASGQSAPKDEFESYSSLVNSA